MATSVAERFNVLFKETLNLYRQITAFQKIVVISVFVGVLLTIFNSWWIRGLTVVYCLSVYGSVNLCKYLTTRQKYFASHLILQLFEKLEDLRLALRKLLSPILVDPNESRRFSTALVDNKPSLKTITTHSKVANDEEVFFDALDQTEKPRSQSVFYLDDFLHNDEIPARSSSEKIEPNVTTLDKEKHSYSPSTDVKSVNEYQLCLERQKQTQQECTGSIPVEVDRLLFFINRDFVKAWYDLISSHDEVLQEAFEMIQHVFIGVQIKFESASRVKLDIARDFLLFLRQHVQRIKQARLQYKILYRTARRSSSRPLLNGEPISPKKLSVTDCFISKYGLHPALKDESSQRMYLDAVLEVLLQELFPDALKHSKSVRVVFKEILLCNVLGYVLTLLSTPSFLHECIVRITSDEVILAKESEPRLEKDLSVSETTVEKDTRCVVSIQPDTQPLALEDEKRSVEILENVQTFESTTEPDASASAIMSGLLSEEQNSSTGMCNTALLDGSPTKVDLKGNECNILTLVSKEVSSRPVPIVVSSSPPKEVHFFSPQGSPSMKYSFSDSELDRDSLKHDSEGEDTVFENKSEHTCSSKPSLVDDSNSDARKSSNFFTDSFKLLLKRSSERVKSAQNLEKIDETNTLEVPSIKRSKSSQEIVKNQDTSSVIHALRGLQTFQNVSISTTETAREPSSAASYTLYVVTFDALYPVEDDEVKLKSGIVKRRFREFVNLQACLDSNAKYKGSMKDVKGPRRWLSLPFGNMDRTSIENRRALLENFLKALVQKDDICNGSELKEFLGYSGDGHIAYVRKVQDNAIPRIDQIARKMSGVIDTIVDKLPSITTPDLPKLVRKEESVVEDYTLSDTDELVLNYQYQDEDQSFCKRFCKAAEQVIQKYESKDDNFLDSEKDPHEDTELGISTLEWQEEQLHQSVHGEPLDDSQSKYKIGSGSSGIYGAALDAKNRTDSECSCIHVEASQSKNRTGSDSSGNHVSGTHANDRMGSASSRLDLDQDTIENEPLAPTENNEQQHNVDPVPLARALLDILVEMLYGRENWVCRDKVINTTRLILGKAIQRYLQKKVDMLTSGEMTVFYLQMLRDTIWPGGKLSEEGRQKYTQQEQDLLKQQATRCLSEFLPGILKTLLGDEDFEFVIDEVIEMIKYEQLNRHFWFCILDILLERLFPELTPEDMCDKIFGPDRLKAEVH